MEDLKKKILDGNSDKPESDFIQHIFWQLDTDIDCSKCVAIAREISSNIDSNDWVEKFEILESYLNLSNSILSITGNK